MTSICIVANTNYTILVFLVSQRIAALQRKLAVIDKAKTIIKAIAKKRNYPFDKVDDFVLSSFDFSF